MTRIVRILLAVAALLVGVGTTTASAATFSYDVAVHTPNEAPEVGWSQAQFVAPHSAREGSASPSVEARGTSTTPISRSVATEAAEAGPTAGSGGALEHLTPGEVTRIQNAANKIDQPISVVGSRASGTAGPYSDWDDVVEGANSSTIGKIRNSLPEGVRGIGDLRNLDIFRGPLNEDLPFITFKPVPR